MNSPTSSTVRRLIQSDICIVGNGAIAKTTALAFSQAGQSVTMLSPTTPAASAPADDPGWDVRVYALNHTAHDLLSALKVWGALDAARVAPVDAMLVNGDGAHAGGLAFDAYGAHTGTLAWIVEDRNLNQALDAALKFAPNVQLVSGRASGLVRDADGATVHLDDATIRAALVVGADGAQSWVRPVRHRPRLPRLRPVRRGQQLHLRAAAPRRCPPVVHRRRGHHRAAAAAGQYGVVGVVGARRAGRHAARRVGRPAGGTPGRLRRPETGHAHAAAPGAGARLPAGDHASARDDGAARGAGRRCGPRGPSAGRPRHEPGFRRRRPAGQDHQRARAAARHWRRTRAGPLRPRAQGRRAADAAHHRRPGAAVRRRSGAAARGTQFRIKLAG